MYRKLESDKFKEIGFQSLIGPPIGMTQLTPIETRQMTYDYVMYTNPTNIAQYKFKKEKQEIVGSYLNDRTIQFIFHDDGLVDPNSLNFEIEIENTNKNNYLQLDGTPHSIIKSTKWEIGNKILEEIPYYNILLSFLNDKTYNENIYNENDGFGNIGGGREILLHPQVYGTDHIFNPDDIVLPKYEESPIISNGLIDVRPSTIGLFKVNIFSYIFNNKTKEQENKFIPLKIFKDMKLTITLNDYCFFVPVFRAMVNDLVNGSYNNSYYNSFRQHKQDITSFRNIKRVVNEGLGLEVFSLQSFLSYFAPFFQYISFYAGEFDELSLYNALLTKLYNFSIDASDIVQNNTTLSNISFLFNHLLDVNRPDFNLIDSSKPNLSIIDTMSPNDVYKLFAKVFKLVGTTTGSIIDKLANKFFVSGNLDYFDYGWAFIKFNYREMPQAGQRELLIAYEKNKNLNYSFGGGSLIPSFDLATQVYENQRLRDRLSNLNIQSSPNNVLNYLNTYVNMNENDKWNLFGGNPTNSILSIVTDTNEFANGENYLTLVSKTEYPEQFYTYFGTYVKLQTGLNSQIYKNLVGFDTLILTCVAYIPGVLYIHKFVNGSVPEQSVNEQITATLLLNGLTEIGFKEYMYQMYNAIRNESWKKICLQLLYLVTSDINLHLVISDVMRLIYACYVHTIRETELTRGDVMYMFTEFDKKYQSFAISSKDILNDIISNANSIVDEIKSALPEKKLTQSSFEYSLLNDVTHKNETEISRQYTVRNFKFTYDVYYDFCGTTEKLSPNVFEGSNIPYYKILDMREFNTVPPRRFYLYLYDDVKNIYQLIYNKAYKTCPTYRLSNRYSRQMRAYWVDLGGGGKRYPQAEYIKESNTSSSSSNFVFEQLKTCMNVNNSSLNNLNTALDTNTSLYVSKKLNNAKSQILLMNEKINVEGEYVFGYDNETISRAIFGINIKDIKKTLCGENDIKIKEFEIYMDSNIPLDQMDDFALFEMFTIGEGLTSFKFEGTGSDKGILSSMRLVNKNEI